MIVQGSKSGRKKSLSSSLLVICVVLLVGVAAFYALWPQLQPHVTLHLGDGVFKAKLAKTEAAREQGLGGTSQLASDQAMIFVFSKDEKWSMWMRDMNYPIDMIWLNSNKQVVYIVKNASPDSYPENFTPNTAARYVIEVPAGTVDAKTIHTDSQAAFDENNLQGLQL